MISRQMLCCVWIIGTMVLAAGCLYGPPRVYGAHGASRGPETQWSPPSRAIEKQAAFTTRSAREEKKDSRIPAHLIDNIDSLTLADVVTIALVNSTQTRQAWEQALSASAAFGSQRGSYFPQINATASGGRERSLATGAKAVFDGWVYSPSLNLNWLLFDFGGRKASVDATREALFAADWTHNAAIQSVILQVEQAFYGYFAAKSLLAAEQATVEEAKTNLVATQDRRAAGVATIADELQARTALSQSLLTLETLQGQIQTTRGLLATAMGLPANTAFDVEMPILAPPVETAKKSVGEYLDMAKKKRPDLAAARAQAMEAQDHARAIRAQAFPSITANGSLGQLYFQNLSGGSTVYSAMIGVNIPLFAGLSHYYDAQSAFAQARAALAAAQNTEDLVTLQVWTSYYNFETADQTVRTSDDLLSSAQQNRDVASGRYKTGVGTILDLLTAQASLESARAQQVQARAQWWTVLAQLAHDTGTLEADSASTVTDAKKGKNQ